MLAYSHCQVSMELGMNHLSLFDILRTTKVASKNRLPSKPSKVPDPVKKSEQEVKQIEKLKHKKTVRFSETVHVRTFRPYPVELEPMEPKPILSEVSNKVANDEKVVASTKTEEAPVTKPSSYILSPYFQAFEASRDLITIPCHYCI